MNGLITAKDMTDVKNIGEFDDLWRKSRGLEIQGILP
jgi:hypothetical protein